MDWNHLESIKQLNLCPRCSSLFLDHANDHHLSCKEDEILRRLKGSMMDLEDVVSSTDSDATGRRSLDICNNDSLCPCCLGCLQGEPFDFLVETIRNEIESKGWMGLKAAIWVEMPPVLDVSRLAVRTIVTRSGEKKKDSTFPSFADIFQRVLALRLRRRNVTIVDGTSNTSGQIKIVLKASMIAQEPFCKAIILNYQHKKKRRKLGVSEASAQDEHEVTRIDADGVATQLKTLQAHEIKEMESNLIAFMASSESKECKVTLQSHVTTFPIYLLGRYRKLARDVPQSPWTLGGGEERKGRNSVEEIIGDAVKGILHAGHCRMHACGREDIDVRCLGNGRPFIMEVMDARILPEDKHLQTIIGNIAARHGLNKEGDVDVVRLQVSNKTVWEGMQAAAEEKKKAYICVVWSASKVTRELLRNIEALTLDSKTVDPDGKPCLEIIQKTPLRVLHRRSLIDRKRYIYDIETNLLNDHYFLLSLVTSAGTYVKEFVHGDLGRTVPNISSLLQCQADILQLDVTWLFDDFEGGGERSRLCDNIEIPYCDEGINKREGVDNPRDLKVMSWMEMKHLPLANVHVR